MMKKWISFVLVMTAAWMNVAWTAADDTPPLFRVGLMTDTHWRENEQSFERTAAALKVFKREKVDGIWHLGDIANVFCPPAYRYYRQTLFPKIFRAGFFSSLPLPDLAVKDLREFVVCQRFEEDAGEETGSGITPEFRVGRYRKDRKAIEAGVGAKLLDKLHAVHIRHP